MKVLYMSLRYWAGCIFSCHIALYVAAARDLVIA